MKFYEDIDSELGNAEVVISHDMAKIIQQIWQSSGIQLVHERRFSYQLLDNAKLFVAIFPNCCRTCKNLYQFACLISFFFKFP